MIDLCLSFQQSDKFVGKVDILSLGKEELELGLIPSVNKDRSHTVDNTSFPSKNIDRIIPKFLDQVNDRVCAVHNSSVGPIIS